MDVAPDPQAPGSEARSRLIIALDYPDQAQAIAVVNELGDAVRWYKVGLELYLATGQYLVSALVDRGLSVFLDLKLHDIPNTVAGAVRSAARSGASLLTIHAAGGPAMIAAAVEAAHNGGQGSQRPPKILAVTVLTSMDAGQLVSTGISATPAEQVQRLGAMAVNAGADGLVCSPAEAAALRKALGAGPLLVTPGIRPEGAAAGDQKRIATPAAAIRAGASYLVVGRPITQAEDRRRAAEQILAEVQDAL